MMLVAAATAPLQSFRLRPHSILHQELFALAVVLVATAITIVLIVALRRSRDES